MGTKVQQNASSVTITKEDDWFVAHDEETGVASQGKTRPEALANLAEAIRVHQGGGEEIEDPEAFLEEIGAKPEGERKERPPWFDT